MIPRANRQSIGYLVAQVLSPTDDFGTNYDETNLPILYGARYAFVADSSGIPQFQTVAGTDGPVFGLFPWPAKAPRELAQLSWVFPAKITSPGNATPVQTPGVTDPGLAEVAVVGPDNSAAPGVGTYGLAIVGTHLHSQTPIFFAGGGGMTLYQVTSQVSGSTYNLQQYSYPGGATVGAATTGVEFNGSTKVPVRYVWGQTMNGTIYFDAPYGC